MIQFGSYHVLGRLTICAFYRSNDSNAGVASDTDEDEDVNQDFNQVGGGGGGSGVAIDTDVNEHFDQDMNEDVHQVGKGTGAKETEASVVRGIGRARYNSSNSLCQQNVNISLERENHILMTLVFCTIVINTCYYCYFKSVFIDIIQC